MNKTAIITTSAAILATQPYASAILGVGDIVSDPVAEQALMQKNIFDQLKYAWEQTQWAEKLETLHSTLSTVQEQLQTANKVKAAIGDPVAAIGMIDNGAFSGFLKNSGIQDTLTDLSGIAQEGAKLSGTINELFQPIDLSRWKDVGNSFDGVASFRDPNDPLKQYRAMENAFSRFQQLLLQAQSKRLTLNGQISSLTEQLKNAQDDAEVQKLSGSLQAAQSALGSLDIMVDAAHQQVESLQILNANRKEQEEVAADQISRDRNRQLARQAAAAEAAMPDLEQTSSEVPPGF